MDDYFYKKFRYKELNSSKLIFIKSKKPNDSMMNSIFSNTLTPHYDLKSPKMELVNTEGGIDLRTTPSASPEFNEKKTELSQLIQKKNRTLNFGKPHGRPAVSTENEMQSFVEKRKYSFLSSLRSRNFFFFFFFFF